MLGNNATRRALLVVDYFEDFELGKAVTKLLLEDVISQLSRHPVQAVQHEADF